jgi:hypothetical protein
MDAVRRVARPASGSTGVACRVFVDLMRSNRELLVQNAMLRQQLVVAARHVKRPRFNSRESALLVVLASM